MQLLNNISRYLLGILLLVLGANGFLQFLPYPRLEPDAGAFMAAIASTGMIFLLLGLIEIVSGILLLSKKL
jgi:putative oxidoreductase